MSRKYRSVWSSTRTSAGSRLPTFTMRANSRRSHASSKPARTASDRNRVNLPVPDWYASNSLSSARRRSFSRSEAFFGSGTYQRPVVVLHEVLLQQQAKLGQLLPARQPVGQLGQEPRLNLAVRLRAATAFSSCRSHCTAEDSPVMKRVSSNRSLIVMRCRS